MGYVEMKKLLFTALFCLACFPGCSRLAVRQSTTLPQDPAAYLSDTWERSGAVSNVSGFAKLRIEANGQTTNSRNVFFVKRDPRIRIETLGFLSRPALFFTADKTTMQLYAVESNSIFSGRTSARNFSRIIGMPLDLTAIVQTFLGQPPLFHCPDRRLRAFVENGQYVFKSECGVFSELVQVHPQADRITRCALFENGNPVYDYSFSDFQKIDGILFPLKIKIYNYTYNTAITLNLDSLSFDSIPEDRFIITHPENVKRYALEELFTPR